MRVHMLAEHLGLYMSLSIVSRVWIQPEVVGALFALLKVKEHYAPVDIQIPPIKAFPYPGMNDFLEYSLYRGWMEQYLAYLKWYCLLDLNPTVRLDDLFNAPTYTSTWYTDPMIYRFGILFRMYDWCIRLQRSCNRIIYCKSQLITVKRLSILRIS